jgi:hypothetical protein
MTDEALDLPEIAAHQFTQPLPAVPAPSTIKQFFMAAVSARRWFRVGWTCQCVVDHLTTAEQEMLLRGELANSLDIYQLQGTAAASAGTHSKYACYDLGQTSDAQIDTLRRNGGCAQRRYTWQGFAVGHTHGFPNGCPHGAAGQKSQQVQWNNGTNGLVSRGKIEGRWPIKNWKTALTERRKVVMALKDDIANAVIEKLKGQIGSLVWDADEIPNTFSGNTANKTVPAKFALQVLGSRTTDIGRQVNGWDNIPAPTDDPKNPNWVPASYLRETFRKLLAHDKQIAALNTKLDAILAALKGPQA